MTIRSIIMKIVHQPDVNFLLTNRIPRHLATRFMGWFSRIEHPLVRDLSIAMWRFFSDLDLSEAKTAVWPPQQRLADVPVRGTPMGSPRCAGPASTRR